MSNISESFKIAFYLTHMTFQPSSITLDPLVESLRYFKMKSTACLIRCIAITSIIMLFSLPTLEEIVLVPMSSSELGLSSSCAGSPMYMYILSRISLYTQHNLQVLVSLRKNHCWTTQISLFWPFLIGLLTMCLLY